MDSASPSSSTTRSTTWTYWICGLLFLATTINYMDRLALNDLQSRLKSEFSLSEEQYGRVEKNFGIAFAVGSVTWGIVADMVAVRWFYPLMLMLWSLAGCSTGFVRDYDELLWSRTFLGFFEAAHWPCALQTTQRILAREKRTWGNSLLQSGSSVGAILTPLLVMSLLQFYPTNWRLPFFVIGLGGLGWVVLWLASVRKTDLLPLSENAPNAPQTATAPWSWLLQRLAILVVTVITINITWHLLRVWQTPFLETGRGYTETERRWFLVAFGIMNDIGCLAVGYFTVVLARGGVSANRARVYGFSLCALCTMFTLATPWLGKGWMLQGVMMIVAAGALGLFPCYYAFGQEISAKAQGKVTGFLGTIAWVPVSLLHPVFGAYVDQRKLVEGPRAYDLPFAATGCLPILAAILLILGWRDMPREAKSQLADEPSPARAA